MIIEASPLNLDPRVGIDAFSERIDQLLFDGLVRRDEHFNLQPALAERWEIPDPLTYIFHLRSGVHFHDGQLMTARDVKWTFDSMFDGTVITSKTGAYQYVKSVEAPDDRNVIFHLKEPFSALLWNLGDGAIGIVPYGSGKDFSQHPVGTGIFKLMRNEQDNEVVVIRNDDLDSRRVEDIGIEAPAHRESRAEDADALHAARERFVARRLDDADQRNR